MFLPARKYPLTVLRFVLHMDWQGEGGKKISIIFYNTENGVTAALLSQRPGPPNVSLTSGVQDVLHRLIIIQQRRTSTVKLSSCHKRTQQ